MHKNVIVCEAKRVYNYLFNVCFKDFFSPEEVNEIRNLIA